MKCVSTRNWSTQTRLNKKPPESFCKPRYHCLESNVSPQRLAHFNQVLLVSTHERYVSTVSPEEEMTGCNRGVITTDRALMFLAVRQGEGVMKKQSCESLLSTRFLCEQGYRALKTILHPPHAFNLKFWCIKNQCRVLKELDFGISDCYVAPWYPKTCSCCARFLQTH